MFTSLVLCIGTLILLLLELTPPIQCTEYDTKCYTVGNRNVCFFRPEFNYTWVTWYKASAVCRRKNGTLPFIPDKAIHGVFKDYMNSLPRLYVDDMWMAGREVRKKEWTWSNDSPFNEPNYFAQTHTEYNSSHLQAVLTNQLVYRKEHPGSRSNYVCQFLGETCKSRDSIPLKNGCIMMYDGALDLYEARNNCVEKGGDLPVIDGQDDLYKFQQVFSRIRTATETHVWLGLRRQWWMWNVTGTVEMKYSNWLVDNGFKSDLGCVVYNQDHRWIQENCTAYKRFICQTGPNTTEVPTKPPAIDNHQLSSGFLFLVAGISALVLTILVVIIVVAVVVKKRKTRLAAVRRDMSYQHLQSKSNGRNYPQSDQHYTELHPIQPPTKKRPLPTTPRPLISQQTEQNPDYVYDDIIESRAPSYLEVIH